MNGAYFIANERVRDLAVAFLNSFRTFEPELPLCLIPYDSQFEGLLSLSAEYGFSLWSDAALLERCDDISRTFHSNTLGQYRKLAMWEGQYDNFAYIDVDTVLLSSLDQVFPLLAVDDVITGVSNIDCIRRFVWLDSSTAFIPEVDTQYSANTGFIASKRGVLTVERAEMKAMNATIVRGHMALNYAEQPFLNYLIVTSGIKYTSLSQLRRRPSGRFLPKQLWAGSHAADLLLYETAPLLIHWAGKWQTGDHFKNLIWRHFRGLRGDY